MKKPFWSLAALAAALVALVSAPRAQAQIVTFNTIVANNGNSNTNFTTGNNVALSQTFTNVAELNNVTYEFVENGVDTTDQTINAYLVQWNTTNNSAMSTITLETTPNSTANESTTALTNTPMDTFVVPPASGDANGTWSNLTYSGGGTYPAFQETLNINQLLDPSLTYAIVLIDTSGSNGTLGLPGVDVSDTNNSFDNSGNPYGIAYENNSSTHPYTSVLSMVTNASHANFVVSSGSDTTYGFSQIQLVPGTNIVPTPEPRTAAAILCALFVAALVGRQLILRRKEDADCGVALAA